MAQICALDTVNFAYKIMPEEKYKDNYCKTKYKVHNLKKIQKKLNFCFYIALFHLNVYNLTDKKIQFQFEFINIFSKCFCLNIANYASFKTSNCYPDIDQKSLSNMH